MAHIGQKSALGPVRRLGGFLRLLHFNICFAQFSRTFCHPVLKVGIEGAVALFAGRQGRGFFQGFLDLLSELQIRGVELSGSLLHELFKTYFFPPLKIGRKPGKQQHHAQRCDTIQHPGQRAAIPRRPHGEGQHGFGARDRGCHRPHMKDVFPFLQIIVGSGADTSGRDPLGIAPFKHDFKRDPRAERIRGRPEVHHKGIVGIVDHRQRLPRIKEMSLARGKLDKVDHRLHRRLCLFRHARVKTCEALLGPHPDHATFIHRELTGLIPDWHQGGGSHPFGFFLHHVGTPIGRKP